MRTLLVACFCIGLATSIQAQTIRQIPLVTNHIVYDSVTDRIYASVPSRVGSRGNSITAINPTTGAVAPSIFVGSEPDKLALTDDGQFLYVGLDGAAAVRRFRLATRRPELQFFLGTDPQNGPFLPIDIATPPGHPHTVVVARSPVSNIENQSTLTAYDDGVPRSLEVQSSDYPMAPFASLAFSDKSTRLYGLTGGPSDIGSIGAFRLDDFGLTVDAYVASLLPLAPLTGTLQFNPADGYLYTSYGNVLQGLATSVYQIGAFPAGYDQYNYNTRRTIQAVLPDTTHGRAFLLVNGNILEACDAATFEPRGALIYPGPYSSAPGDLLFCGPDRLAFRTETGVYLVDGLSFPQLDSLQLDKAEVGAHGKVTGTVTLSGPAPPGGARVQLSEDSYLILRFPSYVVVPAGETHVSFTMSAPYVTKTARVTLFADYGTQESRATLEILDNAGHLALPLNVRALSLHANALVFNPFTKRILASVPGNELHIGNTIASINPRSGTVEKSTFLGSEPDALALSDDGEFLYVCLDGSASVCRFDLNTNMTETPFWLGNSPRYGPYTPSKLATLPGQPHSVVVLRWNWATPDLAVYDDGNLRVASSSVSSSPIAAIATGSTARRIYAVDEYGEFIRFGLGLDRIGVVQETNSPTGRAADLHYQNGRMFGDSGVVFDPETNTILGMFPVSGLALPDLEDNRVFFLQSEFAGNYTLFVCDPSTYTLLASYPVAPVSYYGGETFSSLIRCGNNQVAFSTSTGQVYVIDASPTVLRSLQLGQREVKGGLNAQAKVLLTNVAPIENTLVTLSSSDPTVATVPERMTLRSGANEHLFTISTLPVTTAKTVVLSASSGGVTRTVTLTVNP